MTSTAAVLTRHGESLVALVDQLRNASSPQWEPAPRVRAADVGGVQTFGHADPTALVALDERRLKLRAAVIEAEAALTAAAFRFEAATAGLEAASAAFHGDETHEPTLRTV